MSEAGKSPLPADNGPPRVLMVHNYYREPGGEDRVFDAEVELLRDRGVPVETFIRRNAEIESGPVALAAGWVWNRDSYRSLSEAIERFSPAVVHFHNTRPLISPAGFYAAARRGVPVVYTLHNYALTCVNGLFFRDEKVCEDCLGGAVLWRGIPRRCFRNSVTASASNAFTVSAHRAVGTWRNKIDAYIALSAFSRQKFLTAGLPANKIHVKPNFLPDLPVDPAKDPSAPEDVRPFVFVGRLSPEKGIDTLLDAWRQLPKDRRELITLRIIGDGPKRDRVIAASAEDPSITWDGFLPNDAVEAALNGARALVFPTQCYENCPMVVIEAFRAHLPVIGSSIGATAEMINPGKSGLLYESGNPQALAQCMARMIDNPSGLLDMAFAARRVYEQHYRPDDNFERLMDIYRSVGGQAGQP